MSRTDGFFKKSALEKAEHIKSIEDIKQEVTMEEVEGKGTLEEVHNEDAMEDLVNLTMEIHQDEGSMAKVQEDGTIEKLQDDGTMEKVQKKPAAKIKRTVKDVKIYLTSFDKPSYPLKKGYIAQLLNSGHSKSAVAREIIDFLNTVDSSLTLKKQNIEAFLGHFDKRLRRYKRHICSSWDSFLDFCDEEKNFPIKATVPVASSHTSVASSPTSVASLPKCTCFTDDPYLAHPTSTLSTNTPFNSFHLTDHTYVSHDIDVPSKHTHLSDKHTHCQPCKYKQQTIKTLRNRTTQLTLMLKEERRKHRNTGNAKRKCVLNKEQNGVFLWKKRCTDSKMNQKQVNTMTLGLTEFDCLCFKSHPRCAQLKKKYLDVSRQRDDLSHKLKLLSKEYDKLMLKLDSVSHKLKDLRQDNGKKNEKLTDELQCAVNEFQEKLDLPCDDDAIDIKSEEKKNLCKTAVRKCMYYCFVNNVSLDKIGHIVAYVTKSICKKSISAVFRIATLTRLACELSVLSDIQIGHELHKNSESLTLGSDSTTYEEKHVTALHVCTFPSKQNLTLDLSVLPNGSTEDYVGHVGRALLDIVGIYSQACGLPDLDVKELVWSKLNSTVSDRAKVNYSVVQQLREEFDLDLLERKSCVHPLDGLARAAKVTLSGLDKAWGLASTSNGQTEFLVHSLVTLRFNKSKGDPVFFKSFLQERKIKTGVLNRYIGNRINIIFQLAATFYHLRTELLEFTWQSNKPLSAQVAVSLEQPLVQVQLLCLGLFSKVLTGPLMRKFYKNRSRMDVFKDGLFQSCMTTLDCVQRNPDTLFTTQHDVFGEPLDMEDPLLQNLQAKSQLYVVYVSNIHQCIQDLATAFSQTLKTQLWDYLEGPFAAPTKATMAAFTSAPLSNLHADRTLTMMDALLRRAPSAALGFLESKCRSVLNHTVEWLDGLNLELQEKYINFAISWATKVSLLHAQREKADNGEIAARGKQVAQKVDKTLRSTVEASVVDRLSKDRQSVMSLPCFDSLDGQIREKLGKFMCGKSTLTDCLLEHVWNESGHEVVYLEMVKDLDCSADDARDWEIVILYCPSGDALSGDCDEFSVPLYQFLVDFALEEIHILKE